MNDLPQSAADTTQEEDDEPSSHAYFFDFDGTLARIVDQPDQARLEVRQAAALEALLHSTGGAVAVVSGRSIAQLDGFLAPLKPPAAGVHGLEFRDPDGTLREFEVDPAPLISIREAMQDLGGRHRGLIVEVKPGAVALHYRQKPELETECVALARLLHDRHPGTALLLGKMVAELRLGGRSKADAVDHFMEREPFRGRRPVFAGDDVTDEDGFRRVAELGGAGLRIGYGATRASRCFEAIEDFWRWLDRVAGLEPVPDRLSSPGTPQGTRRKEPRNETSAQDSQPGGATEPDLRSSKK